MAELKRDKICKNGAKICLAVITILVTTATTGCLANQLVAPNLGPAQGGMQTMQQHQQQFQQQFQRDRLQMAASSQQQQQQQQQHSIGGSSQAISNPASLFKDMSGPTSGKVQTLDVICGKNFMTVRAEFSAPFYGIVFSKGTYGHENCIYVKPNSGLTHAAFNVYYDQCGTKPDLQGKFYENTIVIQYGSDIIEAYDEAKRLRCEWFEAYEKPATFKPAIPVADLEVVEMNFQGDDIDCWMEIQEGTGPMSREVSKIVPVGQPMTIVVAINDYNGQFDMRVKSCMAHDGVQQPIALTDEFGCVLRPKMLTSFQKIKNPGGLNKKATILSYSRFLAFKFPDSMTVQIQCTVEVCRHGCAEACQRVASIAATTLQPELSLTAKWPEAPNQAALRAEASQARAQHLAPGDIGSPQSTGAKVAFQDRPLQVDSVGGAEMAFGARPQDRQRPAEPSADMSGSESALHASHARLPAEQQKRAQDQEQQQAQQLALSNRRPAFSGARLAIAHKPSGGAPTATTSVAQTTIADQVAASRAHDNQAEAAEQVESSPAASSERADDSAAKRQAPQSTNGDDQAGQQPQASRPAEQQDQEQEGGSQKQEQQQQQQAKPSEAAQPAAEAPPGQPEAAPAESAAPAQKDEPAELAEQSNKPSVQAGDEEQPSADKAPDRAQSSLKTVEVEIPANEDPVRAFMAQQQQQQQQPQMASYDSIMFDNSRVYADQAIQPRDSKPQQPAQSRSDQLDEAAAAASQLMLGSGRMRFGARSPQASQQQAASNGAELPETSSNSVSSATALDVANHQENSRESVSKDQNSSGANMDKVLVDRSDDSALISELASAESASIAEMSKPAPGDSMVADESQQAPLAASAGASSSESASRPVVGTDELATGPIQIEDRMGSAHASESLEEALNRLQRQIPQTAALVSSHQQQQQAEQSAKKAASEQQQIAAANDPKASKAADERQDSAAVAAGDKRREPQQANGAASVPQRAPELAAGQTQAHPNVAGQAKVLPDPSNSVANSRGSMLALASGAESVSPAKQVALAAQAGQFNAAKQQQQQQQQGSLDGSKPVAQVTNVPMGIGFSQSQLPAIQQLQQQLAAQFQQQQQQQQQQLKQQQQQQAQSTAKPSRGRFSLLQKPQAALQAVASRLLPKSAQAAQQTRLPVVQLQAQQAQQAIQQQQQQQFLASNSQQAAQQQQAAVNQFLVKQQQQQQQLNFASQQSPQAPNKSAGLFSRLTGSLHAQQPQPQQQQQPLVRTRRSAMAPNGKRGSGEVGMARSFMVVTNMDLAFSPSINETELPQILEGRRVGSPAPLANGHDVEGQLIYGVCMPIVSVTFVLTCAFWLVVFMLAFCLYMLTKSRRRSQQAQNLNQNVYVEKKLVCEQANS